MSSTPIFSGGPSIPEGSIGQPVKVDNVPKFKQFIEAAGLTAIGIGTAIFKAAPNNYVKFQLGHEIVAYQKADIQKAAFRNALMNQSLELKEGCLNLSSVEPLAAEKTKLLILLHTEDLITPLTFALAQDAIENKPLTLSESDEKSASSNFTPNQADLRSNFKEAILNAIKKDTLYQYLTTLTSKKPGLEERINSVLKENIIQKYNRRLTPEDANRLKKFIDDTYFSKISSSALTLPSFSKLGLLGPALIEGSFTTDDYIQKFFQEIIAAPAASIQADRKSFSSAQPASITRRISLSTSSDSGTVSITLPSSMEKEQKEFSVSRRGSEEQVLTQQIATAQPESVKPIIVHKWSLAPSKEGTIHKIAYYIARIFTFIADICLIIPNAFGANVSTTRALEDAYVKKFYFKLQSEGGIPLYKSSDEVIQKSFDHAIPGTYLHRSEERIEIDPKKVPSALAKRKLEIVKELIRKDNYAIQRTAYKLMAAACTKDELRPIENFLDKNDWLKAMLEYLKIHSDPQSVEKWKKDVGYEQFIKANSIGLSAHLKEIDKVKSPIDTIFENSPMYLAALKRYDNPKIDSDEYSQLKKFLADNPTSMSFIDTDPKYKQGMVKRLESLINRIKESGEKIVPKQSLELIEAELFDEISDIRQHRLERESNVIKDATARLAAIERTAQMISGSAVSKQLALRKRFKAESFTNAMDAFIDSFAGGIGTEGSATYFRQFVLTQHGDTYFNRESPSTLWKVVDSQGRTKYECSKERPETLDGGKVWESVLGLQVLQYLIDYSKNADFVYGLVDRNSAVPERAIKKLDNGLNNYMQALRVSIDRLKGNKEENAALKSMEADLKGCEEGREHLKEQLVLLKNVSETSQEPLDRERQKAFERERNQFFANNRDLASWAEKGSLNSEESDLLYSNMSKLSGWVTNLRLNKEGPQELEELIIGLQHIRKEAVASKANAAEIAKIDRELKRLISYLETDTDALYDSLMAKFKADYEKASAKPGSTIVLSPETLKAMELTKDRFNNLKLSFEHQLSTLQKAAALSLNQAAISAIDRATTIADLKGIVQGLPSTQKQALKDELSSLREEYVQLDQQLEKLVREETLNLNQIKGLIPKETENKAFYKQAFESNDIIQIRGLIPASKRDNPVTKKLLNQFEELQKQKRSLLQYQREILNTYKNLIKKELNPTHANAGAIEGLKESLSSVEQDIYSIDTWKDRANKKLAIAQFTTVTELDRILDTMSDDSKAKMKGPLEPLRIEIEQLDLEASKIQNLIKVLEQENKLLKDPAALKQNNEILTGFQRDLEVILNNRKEALKEIKDTLTNENRRLYLEEGPYLRQKANIVVTYTFAWTEYVKSASNKKKELPEEAHELFSLKIKILQGTANPKEESRYIELQERNQSQLAEFESFYIQKLRAGTDYSSQPKFKETLNLLVNNEMARTLDKRSASPSARVTTPKEKEAAGSIEEYLYIDSNLGEPISDVKEKYSSIEIDRKRELDSKASVSVPTPAEIRKAQAAARKDALAITNETYPLIARRAQENAAISFSNAYLEASKTGAKIYQRLDDEDKYCCSKSSLKGWKEIVDQSVIITEMRKISKNFQRGLHDLEASKKLAESLQHALKAIHGDERADDLKENLDKLVASNQTREFVQQLLKSEKEGIPLFKRVEGEKTSYLASREVPKLSTLESGMVLVGASAPWTLATRWETLYEAAKLLSQELKPNYIDASDPLALELSEMSDNISFICFDPFQKTLTLQNQDSYKILVEKVNEHNFQQLALKMQNRQIDPSSLLSFKSSFLEKLSSEKPQGIKKGTFKPLYLDAPTKLYPNSPENIEAGLKYIKQYLDGPAPKHLSPMMIENALKDIMALQAFLNRIKTNDNAKPEEITNLSEKLANRNRTINTDAPQILEALEKAFKKELEEYEGSTQSHRLKFCYNPSSGKVMGFMPLIDANKARYLTVTTETLISYLKNPDLFGFKEETLKTLNEEEKRKLYRSREIATYKLIRETLDKKGLTDADKTFLQKHLSVLKEVILQTSETTPLSLDAQQIYDLESEVENDEEMLKQALKNSKGDIQNLPEDIKKAIPVMLARMNRLQKIYQQVSQNKLELVPNLKGKIFSINRPITFLNSVISTLKSLKESPQASPDISLSSQMDLKHVAAQGAPTSRPKPVIPPPPPEDISRTASLDRRESENKYGAPQRTVSDASDLSIGSVPGDVEVNVLFSPLDTSTSPNEPLFLQTDTNAANEKVTDSTTGIPPQPTLGSDKDEKSNA